MANSLQKTIEIRKQKNREKENSDMKEGLNTKIIETRDNFTEISVAIVVLIMLVVIAPVVWDLILLYC